MITARLLDGGTYSRVARGHRPGLDLLWYPQIDFEEEYLWLALSRLYEVNREMQAAGRTTETIDQWPAAMPGCMWVDWCERYEGSLPLTLHHVDHASTDAGEVPAGAAEMDYDDPEPELYREQARLTSALSWRDVQARKVAEGVPEPWIRLDTRNETEGRVKLGPPLEAKWTGLRGGSYAPELADNPLWTPFDLREWERYVVTDDSGSPLPDQQRWMELHDGGAYQILLRPRRWRMIAWTLAHYVFVTPFEIVLNDEVFIRTYYDRPPVWGARHDVIHTSQETPIWGYFGNPLSYDQGVEWAWERSRSAHLLANEILNQQYNSYCLSYIFMWAEPVELTIQTRSPRRRELVCGIRHMDRASGSGGWAWVYQDDDRDAEYPQSTLGEWYCYWNVAKIAM